MYDACVLIAVFEVQNKVLFDRLAKLELLEKDACFSNILLRIRVLVEAPNKHFGLTVEDKNKLLIPNDVDTGFGFGLSALAKSSNFDNRERVHFAKQIRVFYEVAANDADS